MDAADQEASTQDRAEFLQLVYDWGEAYVIVHKDECWQAGRRDTPGHLLTARDPDELRAAIRADYELKPVPRDLSATGGEL